MASKTEQRKIQIIADGTSVNASMQEMQKASRLLWQEMSKLPANSEEFVKKSQQFQEVKKRLDDTKTAANGTQKSLNELTNEALQMSPIGGIINMITGAFGKARMAVNLVTTSFHTLKGAIIATGLGALIVVLGLLINYFTSTQDGIDKVNRVLEPMRVLVQRLKGVFQQLGGYLAGSFTQAINNPKKAFQSFVDFIQTNFMNRIKAVGVAFEGVQKIISGDIIGGLKTLGDSMIQATTGVTGGTDKMNNAFKATSGFISDSVKQGQLLADMNVKIEQSEIELTTARSELNKKYQDAMEIAKDATKSEQERREAARLAQAAENELLDKEQQFMDQKIERKKLEQSFNDTSREGYQELAQLEAERTQFEIDASKRRTKARSLENTIVKEIHAENQKRSDEARKKEEENSKKIAQLREQYLKAALDVERSIEDVRIALMDEGLAKKQAKLQVDLEREIQALEEKRKKILENETLTGEERQKIIDQFKELEDLKRQENAKKLQDAADKDREEAIKKQLSDAAEDEERELLILENSTIGAIDAEMRKKEALLEIQREYAAEKLAILEAAGEGESIQALKLKNVIKKIDQEVADNKIAEAQRAEDFKNQIQQLGFENARSWMQLGLELLGKESAGRKAFANTLKAVEIGQVVMNGIREVQAIWAGAATLGPIAGPIVGGLQTGVAVARSAMAINKIRTTQYATGGATGSGKVINMIMGLNGTWYMPNGQSARNVGTFAKGGPVGSASFGVIGEAGAEWVGPNWMLRSPKYANIFGYLEAERRKATPFATGGMTGAPQPQLPQNSSATADLQQFMAMIEQFGEMKMVMEDIRDLLADWPTKLRVVNDPRDILDGVRVLNEIESDSRINR